MRAVAHAPGGGQTLSDRVQRRIERLLEQVEEAMDRRDWAAVREGSRAVLGMDPDNGDARAYLAAAEEALAEAGDPTGAVAGPALQSSLAASSGAGAAGAPALDTAPAQPASFGGGRYQVRRFLGEGGRKRVYLAHDTKLDRDVAFALIKTEGLDDEGRQRIEREAQAMGRLGDHPHIVSVHDIGLEPPTDPGHGDQPYLVSQFMAGGDVESLIAAAPGGRVPLETAIRICDQTCQALEHAHTHGIIHRDLKPGNVWLTGDPDLQSPTPNPQPPLVAKLGDFGLAVALDRARLTQAGMMVGTVSYMSPEQALGGEVTPRSDLYSLGAMLYELVTGRPPFVGDESVAIITQHLNTPPVAPSWHAPDLPPGLETLILRLLEKDPARRPESAAEVRQALAAAVPRPHPHPLPEGAGASAAPLPGLGDGQGMTAASPLYRSVFVGRETELRALQAAFDGALAGRGALLMVVGEPGIGKTALCEQLATHAALRGGRTLVGHSYEEGSLSLPYLPFVEAMRAYVLAREPDDLRRDLGSGAQEVARIVSEIRQRLAVEPAPASGVDPDEERWRLFHAVAGFLRNASAVQPLVMVLEDLHWADRGTLDLLVHLARNLEGARLLLVGTYRDIEVDRTHPLSGALAELRRISAFERVLLRGLSAEEVQRMLAAITAQEVRWGLAEMIHRQTEGNPLFVQEVVRYLAEEGLIRREGGRWERAGAAPLEMSIPEGLRDVIGKRLSRLSPECNRVLTVAAVIGRDFGLETLRLLEAAPSEEALLAALEEAVRVGVMEDRSRAGVVQFRFAHAFFRQTLYEEIFTPRRLRLHQEVARALERQHAARVEEHAAELAEHFSQSTDPADLAKAVAYGEMAARRAMAVYAHGAAAHHLAQALLAQEVLDPGDRSRRCDLLLALGDALGPAGEPRRAADEVAPEAFELAEALGDRTRAARASWLGADSLFRYAGGSSQRLPAWQRWIERLDRHAAAGSVERVHADLGLSVLRRQSGQWTEAYALAQDALRLARQINDPEALFATVRAMNQPGFVSARHQAEELEAADEITRRPREGVRSVTLSVCLSVFSMTYLQAGDRARAEDLWAEVEALAARTQDRLLLVSSLLFEPVRRMLDGDLEGALAAAKGLPEALAEHGAPAAGQANLDHLALWPALYLGGVEEIMAAHARAVAYDREGGSTLLGRAPLCLAHAGRLEEARAELRRLLERLRVSEEEDEMPASILADLLHAAVLVEERDAAGLLAHRLEGVTAVGWSRYTLANVARPLGRAAALLGDAAGALACYQRSLDWATRVRHRPEAALTRLEMAELLLDDALTAALPPHEDDRRARAHAHLDFAIAELRAMKIQPALERALRHKGHLTA